MVKFPPVPLEVKPVAHLLKLGDEHDERNLVVAYWARMAACLFALKLVPGQKSPETAQLIGALLDWLESTKKANLDNEGITNETVAHAIIENYALKMFEYGDQQDRAEIFNKNTVKTFYTSGMLMDVLDQFGQLPDEIREKRKYAKWKAAYIHNCLKSGQVPLPGPPRAANENTTGIVKNSDLSPEELATYTKYTGPINLEETKNLHKPGTPVDPPEDLFTFTLPKPLDPSAHAPASSPITPQFPTNPTPFSTPNPPNQQTIVVPSPQPINPAPQEPQAKPSGNGGFQPTPEQIQKAQKYCKYATSALNYDDVKNAIDYLNKAMGLLQTGSE